MATVQDLERRLSLDAVVAISISSMLGSGIFVLPGLAISETGPSVWLAYLLSGLCVLPAAMSKAELATAMPSSGGTYVYIERTFGPLAGTVAGLGLWVSLLLKCAFALIGIGAYLSIVTQVSVPVVALIGLTLILGLNILGVGKVGATIVVVVVGSLASLGVIGSFGAISLDMTIMDPLYPNGFAGLMTATGMVFVSFAGVTKVAAIAEEVKRPERNLPMGILISLLIVTFVYVSLSFVIVGNIPWQQAAGDLRPIHTLAVTTGGKTFGYLAAVVAILTMMSMANAGVLAASRFPFAMSRDRLLPSVLGKISERFLTPYVSIIISCAFVAISILALDVVKIAKLASAFILAIYITENVAVVLLRETRVQWYNPRFKSPFYPYLQILGVVSGFALLVGMGMVVTVALLGITVPGLALYFLYSRHRSQRKGVVGVRVQRRELTTPAPTALTKDGGEAHVVVPLFGDERSPEMLVELGASLAGHDKMEVIHLTEVPEQTDLHDLDEMEEASVNALRRRITTMAKRNGADVDFDHIPSHDIYRTIHEVSSRLHCRWLVKEWGGRTHGAITMRKRMGWMENHLPCHLVTFRDAGIRHYSKLIALVSSEEKDELVRFTSDHLAYSIGAELWLANLLPAEATDEEEVQAVERLDKIGTSCVSQTKSLVIRGERPFDQLIEKSVDFDLLVTRSRPAGSALRRMFGTQQDKLIERAYCSVVAIREHQTEASARES